MPTQRPTLPTGFSLPDAPAIEKALHTDDHIELYRLKSGPESTEILILQRGDPTASLAWWSSLPVSRSDL